jgi:coatomer protein complex subunit alpha (xenin)
MGTLLDRFDEHDGPVRGVDFHHAQPLLASGGDDYRIKVWDYKLRRCLFTLLGHLDYIRTVNFHGEYPWVVSASDDQTIRIWNWQSRSCVSVLTGHNHYVMCASFHPKDDLIVSASLDQTVRVWDITGLRKKTVRGAPGTTGAPIASSAASLHELGAHSTSASSVVSRVNADLFGGNDAIVKYVLEGHDRGVNWASFHPTLPLVISGADDRQVKLWRMNETKAWEVDTMLGHSNNVSCVVFHPKHELIVSNSEDRSIRVWDISKRLGVQTFRRENDRFWILAAHPEQNLLAAGHDSGMIVFKLERERPAFASHLDKMFYVKERYLRVYEFGTGRDVPTLSLRRAGHSQGGLGSGPRSLEYNSMNPSENNLLLFSDHDGGSFELIVFSEDAGASNQGESSDSKRGLALSVVFLARNRFAILDKNRQIIIKDLNNEKRKSVAPPNPSTDCMFFAGTSGRLLLRSDDRIMLFEPQSRRVLSEIQVARIKYVIWNRECSYVALISKHGITIASRDLEQLCSVTETVRVKSGAWDSCNRIFLYTTLNHVKYCLANGDTGIIRTLDVPVYITKAHKKQLFCLDREYKNRIISVDITEAEFKLALTDKNYPEVMNMIKHSRLCGKAIIAYLQEKGFPEVALHFVDDLKTRFKLALACGNIEVAMNTAYEMSDDQCWHRLGIEALRQGNHQVVEMSYQRTKNFERLSFLYLLTGNIDKLRKMLKIAEMRRDIMGRFHNALFLGSATERTRVLEQAGQLPLAYLTAHTHGLLDESGRLKDLLESTGQLVPNVCCKSQLIQPPTPILRADNWPLLAIPKNKLYNSHESGEIGEIADNDSTSGWDADLDINDLDNDIVTNRSEHENDDMGGWGDDLDIDEEIICDDVVRTSNLSLEKVISSGFMVPIPGVSVESRWCKNSAHAADHAAAGSFGSSINFLNRQISIINFTPLRSRFLLLYAAATCSVPGLPLSSLLEMPVQRNTHDQSKDTNCLPGIAVSMPQLVESLKTAYRLFQKGNFQAAKGRFEHILLSIPLVIADSRSDTNEVKELLDISREYITAVRLKNENASTNGVRQMELSAYFTHCNLQPAHLALALNLAMSQTYKGGNFITAAAFARRMLDLPDSSAHGKSELHNKAQAVLQKSEQKARNEFKLNYDERNPFETDCNTLEPIYRGNQLLRCSFCRSAYTCNMKGRLCSTCNIALVGIETLGLVTQAQAKGQHN